MGKRYFFFPCIHIIAQSIHNRLASFRLVFFLFCLISNLYFSQSSKDSLNVRGFVGVGQIEIYKDSAQVDKTRKKHTTKQVEKIYVAEGTTVFNIDNNFSKNVKIIYLKDGKAEEKQRKIQPIKPNAGFALKVKKRGELAKEILISPPKSFVVKSPSTDIFFSDLSKQNCCVLVVQKDRSAFEVADYLLERKDLFLCNSINLYEQRIYDFSTFGSLLVRPPPKPELLVSSYFLI